MKTPSNWLTCRMQDIASIYNGNSISEEVKTRDFTGLATGYNYIATKDIGFDSVINYNNGVKIPFTRKDFKVAPKNTPLLCIEGGSAGRKLGFLSEDVCFGNKLCAFVSPLSKWIYFYLQSKYFLNHFNSNKNGLIGGVSINKLKQVSIPVPPLAEQKRIVSKIEELFAVIDKQVKQLEQTQQNLIYFRKSVLFHFLNSKTNLLCLKDITVKITDGTHKTPKYFNKGIPFLSVKDIYDRQLHFDNCKYISSDEHNILFKRCNPEKGDVLITKSGTIGRTAIVNISTPFSLFVSVALIKPNKKCVDSAYLIYSLDKYIASIDISQVIKGGVVKNLHIEDIKKIAISLPSITEQKAIVKKIETAFAAADKAQAAITNALEQAKQLKQSILKRAFEGKLVPQDPNDKPVDVTQLKKDKQK